MRKPLGLAFAVAAFSVSPAAAQAPEQFPAYIQLRRDVLINADLWTAQPEILAANYGFEGIIGIPGLQTADDLALAVAAGAGVNLDWAALDPLPPFRNLTSGAPPIGVVNAGYGGSPLFGDAMPIEVSWPLLPSSVSPENIAITLNTGQVVTPTVAALNPNYDLNERHVIVVFGEFGNRLTPGQPGAIYPVEVSFVAGSSPLMAVGPDGPVSLVGLSRASTNPYVSGPSLVGAKLDHFSPVGDFAPPALSNASPNDAYSLYGEDAEYRLRLFTSGGFSPDGVSGIMASDFASFFRLHATDADGKAVVIDEVGRVYDLGVGKVEVVGLAEVGEAVEGEGDRAYYVEDHDNYFDVVLKGDEAAIRLIRTVEIPTSAEPGYLDLYNPGGPGRTPEPGTLYTKPAARQFIDVYLALDAAAFVSYADQDWRSYDLDDDLPVVFRVSDPHGPDRLTTSTNEVAALVAAGLSATGVDFANEQARPGVSEVEGYLEPATGDRIYTLDEEEQARLSADGDWQGEGRAFGAFATAVPGAEPVFRFYDRSARWHLFSADLGEGLQREGADYEGIGWYSAVFAPALPREIRFNRSDDVTLTDPIDSGGSLVKAGAGTLVLAAPMDFAGGVVVHDGVLQVDGLLSGGPLTVGPNGTLSGSGLVGTATAVSGSLAPGRSPGTLLFLAPVTMTAQAELEIEIDGPDPSGGAGGYDRILVLGAGNDFTAEGRLAVRLRGISAPAGNAFTPALGQGFAGVVAAQGGVAGSFTGLEQPESGLPPGSRLDTLYGAQTVDLVVTPARYGDLGAAGLAQSRNQRAVGKALDSTRPAAGVRPEGAAAELFPALAPLPGEQIATALDSLSGRVHAEALDAAAAGQGLLQSVLRTRLARPPEGRRTSPSVGEPTAADPPDPSDSPVAWAQFVGSSGEQRAVEGIPGYDSWQRGLAVGADHGLRSGLRLGFAVGQLQTEVSSDSGSADVSSTFAALYGAQNLGHFTLTGQLLGSLDDHDSSRAVRVGSFASDPKGSADGWGLAAATAVSRTFRPAEDLFLEPSAGLSFGHLHRQGFTERDGAAALKVEPSDRSSLRSRLGATLGYRAGALATSLSLGWSHEFLDEAAEISAGLAGADFTARAAAPGRDALDLGAGLGVALDASLSLEGRYLLTASSASTSHGGLVTLRLTW